MQIGLVGKPNVGKSTFFKAATLANVEIANYPFATIKPNLGVAYCRLKDPAQEFGKISNPRDGYVKDEYRFIPVQLIDVAGLVPGASEGKGMGNQFLDDLRQADVLIHVIDASGSTNDQGEPCEVGEHDPVNDVIFLDTELDMWYNGILKKGWEKFVKKIQADKIEVHIALADQLSGLKVSEDNVLNALQSTGLVGTSAHGWSPDQLFDLSRAIRIENKPMVIVCNKLDKVDPSIVGKLRTQFPEHTFIAAAADYELALREADRHDVISYVPGATSFNIRNTDLSNAQKTALDTIQSFITDGTGVQSALNSAVFDVLGHVAVFPGGSKLADKDGNVIPDCFLMPRGSTALDFAYKLHTDLGKNFIRAVDIRSKQGLGKDYVLKQSDIIEIVAGR